MPFPAQRCHGVAAWKYYSWANWADGGENKELRKVTYNKQRNDTVLRVAFHSALGQYRSGRCSEWLVKFSGEECSKPAPIVTGIYQSNSGWTQTPAEVSGFCNATSSSFIFSGPLEISVHVRNCQDSSPDAYTGASINGSKKPRVTSSLVVEEYCV